MSSIPCSIWISPNNKCACANFNCISELLCLAMRNKYLRKDQKSKQIKRTIYKHLLKIILANSSVSQASCIVVTGPSSDVYSTIHETISLRNQKKWILHIKNQPHPHSSTFLLFFFRLHCLLHAHLFLFLLYSNLPSLFLHENYLQYLSWQFLSRPVQYLH